MRNDGRVLIGMIAMASAIFGAALNAADSRADGARAVAIPIVSPREKRDVTVFQQPGRYGGWPANGGIWSWGDEIVVGFTAAWYAPVASGHAVDRGKPFEKWQARSVDGGRTWSIEQPPAFAQGRPAVPLTEPCDFACPDFAMKFDMQSIHVGPTYQYVSADRCRTWKGPYVLAVSGIDKIASRTDYVALSEHECLMFGSAAKTNDKEGRPFCARTIDGGLHWELLSLIGPEPPGFAIMPSTLRLSSGALLTTIRHGDPGQRYNIDAWHSDDGGRHWTCLGDATPDIGGNPPSLVRLKDGRVCLTYGVRKKPFGIRARLTSDEGRSWGPEIVLRDDGLNGDLGYPRSAVRADGQVVTIYYFNGPQDSDRTIQATIWTP